MITRILASVCALAHTGRCGATARRNRRYGSGFRLSARRYIPSRRGSTSEIHGT